MYDSANSLDNSFAVPYFRKGGGRVCRFRGQVSIGEKGTSREGGK